MLILIITQKSSWKLIQKKVDSYDSLPIEKTLIFHRKRNSYELPKNNGNK